MLNITLVLKSILQLIDLGSQVFEEAMAHVALSRVCTVDGVALLDLVADQDLPSSCTGDGPTKGQAD